jgi:hypothetical protein
MEDVVLLLGTHWVRGSAYAAYAQALTAAVLAEARSVYPPAYERPARPSSRPYFL